MKHGINDCHDQRFIVLCPGWEQSLKSPCRQAVQGFLHFLCLFHGIISPSFRKGINFSALIAWSFFLLSCQSIENMALGRLSDMLSSDEGSGAFTRDDDPQLIADALPFALKLYEILLYKNPDDPELNLAAGKAFIMYANGFIQTPASMLPDDDFEKQEMMLERAGKMYLRGRTYVLTALNLDIQDGERLLSGNLDGYMAAMEKKHVSRLYWAAAAWLGAFSCNPFDMEQGIDIYKPVAFLYRALELDEEFDNGAIHDLLLLLWGTMPPSILEKAFLEAPGSAGRFSAEYYGSFHIPGDEESRGRFHFARSQVLSNGKNPGSYINLAQTFPVKNQNYPEFEHLLQTALAIDPLDDPDARLLAIIYQNKARWLLEHREDFFLMDF